MGRDQAFPTKNLWAQNQNLVKNYIAFIWKIIIISGHNLAHGTTQLQWHVQICDLIGWIIMIVFKVKRTFARFQLWTHIPFVEWIIGIYKIMCRFRWTLMYHYEDVTWVPWCLDTLVICLSAQELFRVTSKKISKSALLYLWLGNLAVTAGFPSERVSNGDINITLCVIASQVHKFGLLYIEMEIFPIGWVLNGDSYVHILPSWLHYLLNISNWDQKSYSYMFHTGTSHLSLVYSILKFNQINNLKHIFIVHMEVTFVRRLSFSLWSHPYAQNNEECNIYVIYNKV